MNIGDLEITYDRCMAEGIIRKKEKVDIELAKSLLVSSKEEINAFREFKKSVKYYSILFRMKYEILRKLIAAYLLFERAKINNHQCMNAYLCVKHPELEMDWKILETLRIIRNEICYEGRSVDEQTWKKQNLEFEIY